MFRRTAEARKREFENAALPHADALFNFALKMTHNVKDAEDVVQDTYMRAFRFFHHFEPGTNCRAWLFRILKNVHINSYRKNQRIPDTVNWDQIEEFYDSVAPEDSIRRHKTPEEIFFESSVDRQVEQAIRDLPPEYRAVVVLNFAEDLSYREIAAVLDIPIGTVMSRLHRARKTLKVKLADYAREQGVLPAALPQPATGGVVEMNRYKQRRAS